MPGERARIVVQGQCSDDGSTATLVIIHEENGTWSIHGLGVAGVRLPAFSGISPHFRTRRHLLHAQEYRREMTNRFSAWNEVTRLTIAA